MTLTPLTTLTDAAEREQRANLFALCRAARRKRLRSRLNAANAPNFLYSQITSSITLSCGSVGSDSVT